MKIISLTPKEKLLLPCVATIGFFDGVHKGHQYVLQQVKNAAHKLHLQAIAITFNVHPRTIVQPSFVPELITPLSEKLNLLGNTNIDATIILPFNKEMANLSARSFMQNILKDQLNVQQLIIGYDNKFGKNRTESFEDYVQYGKELEIEVKPCQVMDSKLGRPSSSFIRSLLKEGKTEDASFLLNKPYSLRGKVVHGFQEGRKLGYPTANIVPTNVTSLIPQRGVYAVKIVLLNNNNVYEGMLSIGNRPTYGEFQQTIEVNIFDFSQNIYGLEVEVLFLKRMRSEEKFDSIDALKNALANDEQTIRIYLKQYNKK